MKNCFYIYITLVTLLQVSCAGEGSSDQEINVDEQITFAKHIRPIIHKNCMPCHRPGQPGPFSLISYDDVVKKAKMVKYVTSIRYMPPWPADHTYREFLNQKVLTDEEIDLIGKWVDEGEVFGDTSDMLPPPNYPEGSQLGDPDLTIKVPAYTVKGDNRDRFMMVKVPFEIPQDTFVRAIEFVSGPDNLVHHMNGHLVTYEDGKKVDVFEGGRISDTEIYTTSESFEQLKLKNDDGTFPTLAPLVTNYLPGVIATVYPEGIGGQRITKKSTFLLNDVHYAPLPVELTDSSYINVFYSNKKPDRQVYEFQMGTLGVSKIIPPLIIPPDTIMHFETHYYINRDISLLTINPHMHLLGKSFLAYATTASNDTIPLINIPRWDFHWQYFYTFKKMLKIPEGSVIHVEATMDNTTANPNNPYFPPRQISEQDQSMRTTDEMLQFIVNWVEYKPGDDTTSLRVKSFYFDK